MPATLKKPMKAKTPKKPTSKSKTGNSACSQAASNWQLAIRGKEALSPDTYTTLAKCRAMSRTAKQAERDQASGKLSVQGETAVKNRIQSRFDRGLITKASRKERLNELLAQRAGKQSVATAPKMQITKARLAPSNTLPRGLMPPERSLSQSKTMVSRVKAKQLAKTQANSGVTTLKTGNIKVDPERFQYKLNTGSSGVTDQFQDTRVWNKELAGVVQVWKDPANNQTYVVNGHHRFELAQRLGVNKLNVQYIQAKDAAEARQKGALTNIAEGRGTSIDAAKFLRDSKINNPEQVFQSRGISLSEKTASEGLALRNLAKPIWSKVINEQTPVSRAVAIGKSGLREEDQIGLFNKAEKGQWTASKTLEFGKELKRAPLVKTSSGNLFGDDEFINTAEQRASLAERFRTRMKTDLNLFGKVARSRNAGRLEQVGQNKIDVQSSQVQAKQADQALQMFDIERNYGLVSRTLDKYATRIAGGTKLDKVYPDFERQVSKQLDNAINKEARQKLAAAKWQQRKMKTR